MESAAVILWVIITLIVIYNRKNIKKKWAEDAEREKTHPAKQRRVKKVFVGSWGVFTVWLILFFPVAIIYYFTNIEKEE